ncbi:MAG: hypothetical protein GY931_10195 [Maribacter sp.]|nr:hypothetical protein [Maribacter sp.]
MKYLKKSLFILILPLVAFTVAHKFYVSVTNISYSEKDQALQITSRIFIDDFEQVLLERYGVETQLSTDSESDLANKYIEKYLRTKFLLFVDGKQRPYNFLGKKYDNDIMICYLEIPKVDIDQIKSLEVQNELLTDLFDEQQNVVHFKIKGKKKSFVLIRENNKGMLNL